MATAAKKTPSPSPKAARGAESRSKPAFGSPIGESLYSVFQFFASLKLAVICLATLAALLTYGMLFERATATRRCRPTSIGPGGSACCWRSSGTTSSAPR